MMTDNNNSSAKNGFSVKTNGLGTVMLKLMGQEQPIHLTADEARSLGRQLTGGATDADWQNAVS